MPQDTLEKQPETFSGQTSWSLTSHWSTNSRAFHNAQSVWPVCPTQGISTNTEQWLDCFWLPSWPYLLNYQQVETIQTIHTSIFSQTNSLFYMKYLVNGSFWSPPCYFLYKLTQKFLAVGSKAENALVICSSFCPQLPWTAFNQQVS